MFEKTEVTDYRSLYKRKEELKNEAVRTEIRMRENVRLLLASKSAVALIAGPALSANPFTQMISGGLRSLVYRLFGMHKKKGFFRTLLFSASDRLLLMVSPKIKEELWAVIDRYRTRADSGDFNEEEPTEEDNIHHEKQDSAAD